MSIADWGPLNVQAVPQADGLQADHLEANQLEHAELERPIEIPRTLHRLSTVRQQQGVSHRNLARRLGTDIRTIRDQECESTDLPLSVLYAWQQVLDVPVADLLVDNEGSLSAPIMERARMVKVMKTAAAMLENAESTPMKRMVQMLIEQLIEIMPELKDIGPWHTVGQRRTLDDYGRVTDQPVPAEVFRRGSR